MKADDMPTGSWIVVVLALLSASEVAAAPLGWVTNSGSATVSVIDTATDTVTATIPVGLTPTGVAVAPGGARAYVTNASSGTVSVIDAATSSVLATIPVASLPFGVATAPSGALVYVSSYSSSLVSVIDTSSNVVLTEIPVGNSPAGLAVLPGGAAVYVANHLSGTVSVIETVGNTVVATIPVGSQPEGVAVDPAGTAVYVTNNGSNTLSVIDVATNAVVLTVPVGVLPSGIAVHPAGNRLYIRNLGGTVSVVDVPGFTAVATVTVGPGSSDSFKGLAIHPAGRRLYVPNAAAGTVSVIDTTSNTVTATIPAGTTPLGFGAFIAGCGSAEECDDGNPCTDDLCTAAGVCQQVPNSAPCSDGDPCSTGDTCQNGACVGGPPPSCDDGNPCTTDGCDAATGSCTHTDNSAPCSDGNACTTGDVCQAGACVGGAAPSCDDGNPCTDDACEPASGCTHASNSAPCSDGNACTTGDTCQAGACAGGAAPSCDDGNPCTTDGCDAATGDCTHTGNSAPCSDGNACTTGDACQAGACAGGAAPSCDDGNLCTDDACEPASGCTHADNSAPCNDGNVCTTVDACQNGACTGSVPLSCDDGNACTDDLCDPTLGCLHANNNASCSDANTCTTNDVCNDGVCVGGNTGTGCTACQAVANIPPQGGTFVGTTAGTSSLAGTCATSNNSPERVYRWTPATSGQTTISTCGTGTAFDTVVYLRTGSCTGSEAACNDDTQGCGVADGTAGGSYHGSRITTNVVAGQTYFIVVDGYSGKKGAYSLTVLPPSVCGNGVREGNEQCDGADAGGCPTGQCTAQCTCVPPAGGLPDMMPEISDVSIERNATVSLGDVQEGCAEQTSGVDLLRFSVRSKNIGLADFYLGDPGCPSPCDAHPLEPCVNPEFICSPAQGHNHAHYNNYARYDLLDGNGQALVVGHKQGFCLRDTGTCAVSQYTCVNQGISAGCDDLYSASLGCQYLDITGLPSGTYTLRVTIDPFGRISELSETNNAVSVPVVIQPANTTTTTIAATTTTTSTTSSTTVPGGACASPTVVPVGGGVFTGTTNGGSTLAGTCGTSGTSAERVFQWTPGVGGQALIETCSTTATTYDTVLYLRQGTCGGGELGCNDDTTGCGTTTDVSNPHRGSRLTPTVTAGQTYYIVVDGYAGNNGNFRLVISPPGAPATTVTTTSSTSTSSSTTTTSPTPTTTTLSPCSAATVIPATGGVFTGTTTGPSTMAAGCVITGSAPERIFQWTPSTSGPATIETCSTTATTYDTVLYFRGVGCSGPDLACNDDTTGCGTTTDVSNPHRGSRLTPTVSAGQTYFIVVDGYNGLSGNFRLNVIPPP